MNKEIGFLKDEIMYDLMVYWGNREPGSTFGELALRVDIQNPQKVFHRAATIIAKTHCVFALIDKEHYRKILSKIEARNI